MGPEPALEVSDLEVSYPDGRRALAGVRFRVAQGERVALVGPNGAGKSTLLLALAGVLSGRGKVRVGDVTLSRVTLREVRRRVGLVFQDPDDQLFMPTLAEDVAFGPAQLGLRGDELSRRVDETLDAVGLAGFGPRPPQRLSGGEKRAASLATVLAMRPQLLALDEPTLGLDPRARRRLLARIRALPGTCLVATHDLELVLAFCGRALLLDAGRLVAEGPPRELLADAALMEAHGPEVPLSIRLGGAPEPR